MPHAYRKEPSVSDTRLSLEVAPGADDVAHSHTETVQPETRDCDERVSLAPLDPETTLRALLRVDPKDEPAKHQDEHRGEHRDDNAPAG